MSNNYCTWTEMYTYYVAQSIAEYLEPFVDEDPHIIRK